MPDPAAPANVPAKSVFDVAISRGKDGVLRCKFKSALLNSICAALADQKRTRVMLAGKEYEVWECQDELLALAEECGVSDAGDQLLSYRNGKVEAVSMVPLCSTKLAESDGLIVEPAYPYSATSLDAYAKQMQTLVRTVLASVAPVEISVKLMLKTK